MNIRKSISDKRVHAYHRVHVVYGRKPFPGEVPAADAPAGTSQPTSQPSDSGTGFLDAGLSAQIFTSQAYIQGSAGGSNTNNEQSR